MSTIKCENCGHINAADARFCGECGATLNQPTSDIVEEAQSTSISCPSCGTENLPGSAFCIECGTPLAGEPSIETPSPAQDTRECPKCGFENPPEMQFCIRCRTALQGEEKKKRKPFLVVGIIALVLALLLTAGLVAAWFTELIPHDIFDPSPEATEQVSIEDDDDERDLNREDDREEPDEDAVTEQQDEVSDGNEMSESDNAMLDDNTPTTESTIAAPTETATVTPEPTATHPLEPTKTPTPSPSPTATEIACDPVNGAFAGVWQEMKAELGCATSQTYGGLAAEERFENGFMIWREPIDTGQAVVLYNTGIWRIYKHAPFVEGSNEFPCADANTPAQCPPTPKRGFGTMWCDITDIRAGLGNATECERGFGATMQDFDNGHIFRNDRGETFVLLTDGMWTKK